MNDLTCLEIEELIPGYAFDALAESQRCDVVSHLAECRQHDAELQASRVAASRLPDAIDPVPPQALRGRLLGAFDNAAETPAPIGPRRRIPSLRTNARYALAASVLIAFVLGAWGFSRGGSAAEVHSVNTSAGRLDVIYVPSRDLAVVDFDLPPLPAGKTYQAWGRVNGEMVSIGVLAASGPAVLKKNLNKAKLALERLLPSRVGPHPT